MIRMHRGLRAVLLSCVLAAGAGLALAQPGGALGQARAPLPPGHPGPGTGSPRANPFGEFKPPADESATDPNLPAGTLSVKLEDPSGAPLLGHPVTLLQSLKTPTESKEERLSGVTGEDGQVLFKGLPTESGYQFMAFAEAGPALYATPPFMLDARAGHRVLLHVYPATRQLPLSIVSAGRVSIEPGAEDYVVAVRYEFLNLQPTSWVPTGVFLPLPEEAHAVNVKSSSAGLRAQKRDGKVALIGTASPGAHVVFYNFRLPNPGTSTFHFQLEPAPHLVAMVVEAASMEGMSLSVSGYPEPVASKVRQTDTLLTRLVRIPKTEALNSGDIDWLGPASITITGVPTQGDARFLVAAIATLIAFGGGGLALRRPRRGPANQSADDHEEARRVLLAELVDLERARKGERIGPKTYRQAKTLLLDALARLF